MSTGATVLETRDLGYAYTPGVYAVRHLDLSLARGEVLGLLGRNGAGKTTTVRMLTTLLPPTEGTAILLGQDVRTGGRALRARLGVVLQSESLDFVSVEQNLTLYAFLWGVRRETAKSRAEEMLELFELQGVRKRKPWALSGGERRRFQVARELMHDMEILFLDEPTVGLDAVARRRILRYLKERTSTGLSIVFTTHILHEADQLCDRIAILHRGKLLALDTATALKERYAGAREVSATFASPLAPDDLRALEAELTRRGAVLLPPEGTTVTPGATLRFRSDLAEELLPWVTRWAVEHRADIRRISVEESTLEGAFLGMIGDREDLEQDSGESGRQPVALTGSGGGGPA